MVRSMAPVLGFRWIVIGAGLRGLPLSIGRRLALELGPAGSEEGDDSRSKSVERWFAFFLSVSSSVDSLLGSRLAISITSDTIRSLLRAGGSGCSPCIAAEIIIGENVHSLFGASDCTA